MKQFLIGLAVGAALGGVGGFVINDLTELEDPENAAQVREMQQQAAETDNFFDQLGAQQRAAGAQDSTSPTAPPSASAQPPAGSGTNGSGTAPPPSSP